MTTELVHEDGEIFDAELVDTPETSESTAVARQMTDVQRRHLEGLRAVVAFFEEHPELIPRLGVTFYRWAVDKGDMARLGLQLGAAEKSADNNYFNVTRKFGPHALQVTITRDAVCERKVVGSITETLLVPDPAEVDKLPKIKQTVTTEKVEWLCPESLHSLLGEV